MQNQELYKVVVSLVGVLIFSWSLFGFFVVRWIKSSDDNFKELFNRTRISTKDLSNRIEKQGERIYNNEKILAEKSIMLDSLIRNHNRIHKDG